MPPGSSEAGRRLLLNRLYRRYADDPQFARVRAEAKKVLVPGDGPMNPRLMIIGEAPGAREAQLRKPFVGASGEFLAEMMASVGLEREEVFITNVVKYRPWNNRDPEHDERLAGLAYLRSEHQLLGRPPMVLLGSHARKTLRGPLEGHPIGHWLWMSWDGGYPLLPLHHPAFGIYKRSNRPMMMQQFRAVLHVPRRAEEVESINADLPVS